MADVPVEESRSAVRWGIIAAVAVSALGIGAIVGGLAGSAIAREELEPTVVALTAQVDGTAMERDDAVQLAADQKAVASALASELEVTEQSLSETSGQLTAAVSERDAAIAEADRLDALYSEAYDNGVFVQSQRNELARQLAGLNARYVELGVVYEGHVAAANAQDLKRETQFNALVTDANAAIASLKELLATCHVDVGALYVRSEALQSALASAAVGDFEGFEAALAIAQETIAIYTDRCRLQ